VKPRISIITLGVRDLERSRRFYQDGLGLPRRDESAEGVVFLQMQGVVLALWPREELAKDAAIAEDGSGFAGISLAQNLESKQAVDAMLAEAVAAGGRLVKPAQDVFWGGYAGYFADPDGFLWEAAWNPFMPDLQA
jgi:catechol 2,3-dioxygenase-like lactoylglutathione lyase family enzyme